MARNDRVSRSCAVPDCGTFATVALGQLVAEIGRSGPVKVDRLMLFQSTWNLYTPTALRKFEVEMKRFGRPAGGVPVCSLALLGTTVKSPPPRSNWTIWTVGLPAYIWALLNTQAREL